MAYSEPKTAAPGVDGARSDRRVVDVLGVPVDDLGWEPLLSRVGEWIQQRAVATVAYANVHVVNTAAGDPSLLHFLREASLVYCDGAGVRLGARVLGRSLPPRMTAADFMVPLAERAQREGWRIYWLGGPPGSAAQALERLRDHCPELAIAGTHHGFMTHAHDEARVIEEIRCARPHILFVGMGTPKQELWVSRYRADLAEIPVIWCIGAAAEFVAGTVERAPVWMRTRGLEWLYRLGREPRRMWRRYVVGNPRFLARVVVQRYSARDA